MIVNQFFRNIWIYLLHLKILTLYTTWGAQNWKFSWLRFDNTLVRLPDVHLMQLLVWWHVSISRCHWNGKCVCSLLGNRQNIWFIGTPVVMVHYTLCYETGIIDGIGNFSNVRADSRLAPSQWEALLLSNAVSYRLGVNLESALNALYRVCHA